MAGGFRKTIYNVMITTMNEWRRFNESSGDVLDMSDRESVMNWLRQSGPECIFDDEGELDTEYTDAMTGIGLDELVDKYIRKYEEVCDEDTVTLYRMVKLKSIGDLNLKKVGCFWSFDEEAVGPYGAMHKNGTGYTLTAVIDTADIDWEQGLNSFISYGPTQFECFVKAGSRCEITEIDGKKLDTPMFGVC